MNENDRNFEELSNENSAEGAFQPAQAPQPEQFIQADQEHQPAPQEGVNGLNELGAVHRALETNEPLQDREVSHVQSEVAPLQSELPTPQPAGQFAQSENSQSPASHIGAQEVTTPTVPGQTELSHSVAPQPETVPQPETASQSAQSQPAASQTQTPNYSLPRYEAPNYMAPNYADPARNVASDARVPEREDSQFTKPYPGDSQVKNPQPSQSSQVYTPHFMNSQPADMPTMAAPFGIPTAPSAPKTKSAHRGPGWIAAIAMSVGAALVGGSIGVSASMGARPVASSSTTQKTTRELAPVVESSGEAPNWQKVQEAVGNSVVAIDTQKSGGNASGSGVIIDKEGHVLTNEHVISGAEKIYVTLADGNVYKAAIAGSDQATDLAVLTIENPPSDLTVAQLGDSSALHVGQNVAAIGNPLGLSSTMTTGIISALNRPVQTKSETQEPQEENDFFGGRDPFGEHRQQQSSSVVTNAIQIDAAVNPGNSGGPVFDSAGRVIGITSSIASLSSSSGGQSGSIGLGFAIPINLAQKIAQQLIANGVAEHAFLGVTINDGAAQYDGTTRLGAEVNSVSDGTPAAKAGIKKGDVITKIDNNSVSSATSLTGFVRQYSSGDVVTVTLERDGKLMEVQVTLATKQD